MDTERFLLIIKYYYATVLDQYYLVFITNQIKMYSSN